MGKLDCGKTCNKWYCKFLDEIVEYICDSNSDTRNCLKILLFPFTLMYWIIFALFGCFFDVLSYLCPRVVCGWFCCNNYDDFELHDICPMFKKDYRKE